VDVETVKVGAEDKEMIKKRHGEETVEKEHKEEEERRRVAVYREERENKLKRARRAKEAMEENPDALRKGKWPRCTQQSPRLASSMLFIVLSCNAL
jgi:hypothetical protein